jgi:hypothetical protein
MQYQQSRFARRTAKLRQSRETTFKGIYEVAASISASKLSVPTRHLRQHIASTRRVA